MYQDESIQHSKRQPVCVLEKSSESRCGGQATAECEVRVGEWILFVKDCFITGQITSYLGAHDPSRDAPEEQKGTVQKRDPL